MENGNKKNKFLGYKWRNLFFTALAFLAVIKIMEFFKEYLSDFGYIGMYSIIIIAAPIVLLQISKGVFDKGEDE